MSCAHWHWKSVCVDELNGKPLPSSLGVIAVSLSEIGIVWIVWVCSHQADLCTLQSKVIALMLSVQNYQCLSWLPELLVISKAKELNVITGQRSQGSGCPVFTLVCLNIPYSASSCNSPGRILRIHNSFRVSLIFFGLSSQYETPHVEAVQIWHLEIKLQWFFLWPQPDPQSPTDYTPATSTSTLLPPEATE